MRILKTIFGLLAISVLFIACDKDNGEENGTTYPILFKYDKVTVNKKMVLAVLDPGNYDVLEEGDFKKVSRSYFSDTSILQRFLIEEIGQDLIIDEIEVLSDNEMRILVDTGGVILDTTFFYDLDQEGRVYNEMDTLPFLLNGDELDFCMTVTTILNFGPIPNNSALIFDRSEKEDKEDLLKTLIEDIDHFNLVQGDTLGKVIYDVNYTKL